MGQDVRHVRGALSEFQVMDRQTTTNRWILAAFACAVLAADASIAAESAGKSAPKSGEAISHQEASPGGQLPDPGSAPNKAGADTAGQNSGLAGNRNDAGNLAARPSVASAASGRSAKGGAAESGIGSGGKTTNTDRSAPHGIDLIRPDDGYASLRRRATRSSLVATGQTKKLQVVPPVAVTPHQLSPASTSAERQRNSAGVTLPASTSVGKPDSIHTLPSVSVNTGLARNSVGTSPGEIHRPEIHLTATGAMAPVTGINGTTMGHIGAGGIGGPAKDRSVINGSALRHRF
jgi:hypothetical protein